MIQDIFPSHFLLDYHTESPSSNDVIIFFHENKVLLTSRQTYPLYKQLECTASKFHFTFLFTIDTQKYYLADLTEDTVEAFLSSCGTISLSFYPIRHIRNLKPMALAFAGYTAWHLYSWYQSNRFCGHCGSRMILGTDERKVVCLHCHQEVYPRINPCIIVAVHDKDRLLMTKYANRPVSWFVLIAGFIEIGETAEDTVRREVMEETGVKVKNIRYFGSQPWGIPGNLTLGFTAELDGSDEITLDTRELAEGRWFPREEVPVPDDDVSITSALIHAFADNKF